MLIVENRSGRTIFWTVLTLLILTLTAGCAQEPDQALPVSTQAPLPTVVLKPAESDPTPTLDQNAPTRPLPTPLITRSTIDQEQFAEPAGSPAGTAVPPSATPALDERLSLGKQAQEMGDYAAAAEQFSQALRQEPGLEVEEQANTLSILGHAYLAEERLVDAATIFNQLIALQGAAAVPAEIHFSLGQAYVGQGEFERAIAAYEDYLLAEPELGAYVYPRIAEAHKALGDDASALLAYEAAVQAPAYILKEVENRLLLASAYLAAGEEDAAVAQYDIIHDKAKTESTRGQMTYLAGAAELAKGDVEAAYARFTKGIEEYPGSYDSYLGLVELVKAEVPVDDFQRGLVDYQAAAYAPGIEAFLAYIGGNPDQYDAQAHRYLALSYEALSDLESAFSQLEAYAAREPAQGLLEEAKMRARAGETETAVDLYQQYNEQYPQSEDAPFAAWWFAALTAELGDGEAAAGHFLDFAGSYPEHEDAPQAIYRAAQLALANEDSLTAQTLWMRLAEQYPANLYGSIGLLSVLRAADAEGDIAESPAATLARTPANATYQALRARDLAVGAEPFTAAEPFLLPTDDTVEQEEAQQWLAEQFNLDPVLVSSDPGPQLREDDRLLVGQRLWELGLYEEAKRELESLRQDYAGDPLAAYQLAIFFRDLGLYRSSIIAAATLLNLAGAHELTAPPFIGRLSYPAYYSDLILSLAEQYGYDPRLQFSLVRQESLFESFARSGAAAQGLSQVIPDTGAWIAERLQWPDYENEDLYKPYVGLNFGAYYLAQQLDYFNGDVHAALAAYNAGPGNAIRWHETAGSDLDLFVDTMDFNETKTYVERIYAGFDIYSHLYGAR